MPPPSPHPTPAGRPFRPGGPRRYSHQSDGLRTLIETRGVAALLFDPGTGKTATVIDYACLLALKSQARSARVLVIAPLAAVDTWVLQAETFASPDVDVWAEALGGSIRQKALTLASRGLDPLLGPGYQSARERAPGASQAPGTRTYGAPVARFVRSATPIPVGAGPESLGRGGQARLVLEVINVDTFASRASVKAPRGTRVRTAADLMVEAVRRFAPDLIVVDESHRIKGHSGNSSHAIARLTPLCRRRVILTGTVMPHSPLDVYGQWRFLEPTAFGVLLSNGQRREATWTGFRDRFAQMGGWMGRQVIGFQHLDELHRIMARNSRVARKADALDLPPTSDVIIPVHLGKDEEAAYAEMKAALAARLADGSLASAPNRLAQMMRLRQITSGHLRDDSGAVRTLGGSKVAVVRSLVGDTLTGEKRVVVFAHFRHEVAALVAALSTLPDTEVVSVTGATPAFIRAEIRRRFGSAEPTRLVLVAQMRTMSLAVNELVTASHAIFASLSERRDDFVQARDRLDRIGQTKPVTFWFCLAPGTVDEIILRAHQQRTDLESAMLSHIADRQITTVTRGSTA
jgi:hypothetical protein